MPRGLDLRRRSGAQPGLDSGPAQAGYFDLKFLAYAVLHQRILNEQSFYHAMTGNGYSSYRFVTTAAYRLAVKQRPNQKDG
jgi:hypothetical protein